jgi:Spy/CpxP family protein refolding chaperone
MKRTVWITTAAVALTAALAVPAAAQDPQGRGPGRGMGMGPAGQGGRMGPSGPMALLRGVQLTEAQREQIRAIHEEARGTEGEGRKGMELQRELRLALLADTPDQQKIESLKLAINTAHADALSRRIDVQTRVTQVLTAEQRAQARQNAEQVRPAERGERPGQRRGFGRR